MAAPVSPQALPEDAVVITLLGRKYLFATREEAREWMHRPMSDWEAAQWKDAMERIHRHWNDALAEAEGPGVSRDDIEEALREDRDH